MANKPYVYFIKAGNAVKIGFSTNVGRRLHDLSVACADKPRLVKFLPGGASREREFHRRFAQYRMNGEWFDLRGRLAKYLERCIYPIEAPPVEELPVDKGVGYL